jgi:hypothetical protein
MTCSPPPPRTRSQVVAHPVLYAAMTGCIPVLELFARNGLLTDDLESPLLRTAAANGQSDAATWVAHQYLDARPLGALPPEQQVVKIRREFEKLDADGNGYCDQTELKTLADALGTPLTAEELAEAFIALNTAGDARVTLDELIIYWLGGSGAHGGDGGSGSGGTEVAPAH